MSFNAALFAASAGGGGGPPLLTLPTTDLFEAWSGESGITEAGTGISSWLGLRAGYDAVQATSSGGSDGRCRSSRVGV